MRYYPFYFLMCFFVSMGCVNSTTQKNDKATEESENRNDITLKDIESLRFDDYALSDDSEEALENWQKYHELNEQINFLRQAELSFFIGEKTLLKTFMNDLKTEMPESIKTAPILSRITVLETMLLKLNSTLKLDNIDKPTRLSALKEFFVAMSNLNLQINKKFELDANLVQEESPNE